MEAPVSDTATKAFEKDLQFALEIAARAPSSHNVQPWSLVRATPEPAGVTAKLVLGLDRDRCLEALPDAHELEMHLSCGAYLEMLVTALAARGWRADVTVDAAAGEALPSPLEPLATVRITGTLTGTTDKAARQEARQRCDTALERRTHRGSYQDKPVPAGLAEAVSDPRTFAFPHMNDAVSHPPQWQLTDSAECIESAADFVSRHASIEFTHAGNWAETYRCLRFFDGEGDEDGMPIANLLGPVPSWQRPVLKALLAPTPMRGLGRLGLARTLAGQLGDNVGASPALLYGLMPSADTGLNTRLAAGAQMLVVWLELTSRGLSLHPISVVLQHQDLRDDFQQQLGLPAGRCFFFARVGYPGDSVNPTPRRSADARALIRI